MLCTCIRISELLFHLMPRCQMCLIEVDHMSLLSIVWGSHHSVFDLTRTILRATIRHVVVSWKMVVRRVSVPSALGLMSAFLWSSGYCLHIDCSSPVHLPHPSANQTKEPDHHNVPVLKVKRRRLSVSHHPRLRIATGSGELRDHGLVL